MEDDADGKSLESRQEYGKTALLTDNRLKAVRNEGKTALLTGNRPKVVRLY
jgi:hypothetical protein